MEEEEAVKDRESEIRDEQGRQREREREREREITRELPLDRRRHRR